MKGTRSILVVEAAGFLIVLAAIWISGLFDLPHYIAGEPTEMFDPHLAIFESIFVVALAAIVMFITWEQTKRISQLEALLPICSFCKKIRRPGADPMKQGSWEQIEMYINERTGSQFSHGLCPECAEKHYGKYLKGE